MMAMTNLLSPPTLSFSSSFGPSARKKLSLFSVSCARVQGEESRGERIENCVDDAYVAVCVWWVKGSIHGQSLLLSCTYSVKSLQISLKSAIWSGTVQHHPPSMPEFFMSVTQFTQLRDSGHTKIMQNLVVGNTT